MIETRIYKCEYCGAEFDDEYEAHCHEWICVHKDCVKQDGSALAFFYENGDRVNFLDDFDVDEIGAFTVGNESDILFVINFFEWHGFENPFRNKGDDFYEGMEQDFINELTGLWWFDDSLHYGEWVRVDDQIKKWIDIKNKFEKDA